MPDRLGDCQIEYSLCREKKYNGHSLALKLLGVLGLGPSVSLGG